MKLPAASLSAACPSDPPMQTPEFLAWAIEYTCPLRGSQDGSDPERTERQLRSARAVSDARREGRVLEGMCVQPPDGFWISDALSIFGGEAAARADCRECPANALLESDADALAGCYGLLPLPGDAAGFYDAVERAIDAQYGQLAWPEHYPATRPRWYALWLAPALDGAGLLDRFSILNGVAGESPQLAELRAALNVTYTIGGRVHVRLYPPGRVEGPWWRLAPHCPRCKAEWKDAAARRCGVCGQSGFPVPEQKRRARGRRPYFPLTRLLGAEQAASFLFRYQGLRALRQPPDRA